MIVAVVVVAAATATAAGVVAAVLLFVIVAAVLLIFPFHYRSQVHLQPAQLFRVQFPLSIYTNTFRPCINCQIPSVPLSMRPYSPQNSVP